MHDTKVNDQARKDMACHLAIGVAASQDGLLLNCLVHRYLPRSCGFTLQGKHSRPSLVYRSQEKYIMPCFVNHRTFAQVQCLPSQVYSPSYIRNKLSSVQLKTY